MRKRPSLPIAEKLERRQLLSGVEFTNAVSYAVGSVPTCVAAGDLNGDGKTDLVVANWAPYSSPKNTISILYGNGNGTFQPQQTMAVGLRPYNVVVADLTGDGKQDIVVTDYGSDQVTVLLGNGNGTFQPAANYTVGSEPTAVAVGDMNGDGHLDLLVTDSGSNTISWLPGNGNGTFASQLLIPADTNPHDIALSNLGNGALDMVVTNPSVNAINVIMGNGNGTFDAPQSFSIGQIPSSLAIADFNGDGKPDLAVALDYDYGGIDVMMGNGNGTFQSPHVEQIAGFNPSSVTAVDMNNDGIVDLVATSISLSHSEVSVILGNGDGTFKAAHAFATGTSPTFVAAADFNGDHLPDLAVANIGDNSVSVLLNIPQFDTLSSGVLDVTGGTGNDTINLSISGSTIITTDNGVIGQEFSTSQVNSISVQGLAGNDSITIGEGVPGGVVVGGGGNDTIISSGSGITVAGGPGADSLTAESGNEDLLGGKGPDTIIAGSGAATLIGGSGFDSLVGGVGNSILSGGPGGDTLLGTAGGIDTLLGGIGNDSINGTGADSLDGGGQNDTVNT